MKDIENQVPDDIKNDDLIDNNELIEDLKEIQSIKDKIDDIDEEKINNTDEEETNNDKDDINTNENKDADTKSNTDMDEEKDNSDSDNDDSEDNDDSINKDNSEDNDDSDNDELKSKADKNNKIKSKVTDYKHNKPNLIKAYDFEKNRKLSANNVKFLNALSVEFCKTSNLQMHHELKHENLKYKFNESKQDSLSNFIEETTYNTILINFSIGKAKNLILKVDKICALTFVECLLGGDGSIHNKEREITEIDSAILTYLSEKLFNNLPVDTTDKLETSIDDIFVNTAKFKTPISNSENLFISNIDVILNDDLVGQIAVCIPTSSTEGIINDLVSRMSGALETINLNHDELLENELKVINALCENKVTFDIIAELGKTTITVGELLSLDEDDVLILNKKIDEPIDILVGGCLAYKAQPGVVGANKAIVIEDLAEKGEKIDDGEENN